MKKSLLALFCFVLVSLSAHANTVTVDGETGTTSTYLPVALHTNTSNANYAFHSVSQQLYYASELAGASSNTITAITFDYVGTTMTDRKIAVLMNSTSRTSFPLPNEDDLDDVANKTPNMVDPGTRVFSGTVAMVDGSSYTITFDTPYEWDGTSNIIVTVLDSTAKKNSKTYYGDATTIYTVAVRIFETPGAIRFLHKTSKDQSDYAYKGWDMDDLPAAQANSSSVANRKYANKITFTFAAAAVVPATPSDLHVEATLWNAATLDWSTVEGATSYDMQQSADGETWSTLEEGIDETSFLWEGLAEASTQYARIRASNANGSSEWSDAITVTTDAKHIHDGITFDKWNNPSVLPKQGNFYLKDDVEYDPLDPTTIILTGNLNLCLNGHEANLYGTKIVVPDGKTLTIYDNVGGGKITGFVQSVIGGSETYSTALIVVYSGGTLVLKQGTIENTYTPDVDGESYAIYSNGTVRISGDVLINSNSADIYLYASNIITLDGAISNTEKHTVWKNGGAFTSGWSTYMSGEDPCDFFESANPAKSVCLNEGEAALRSVINIRDNADNTSTIHTNDGQTLDVSLTRTWEADGYYSTLCLPFDLSSEQVSSIFGAGTELATLSSSSIDEETIYLVFESASSVEAGKPYLINPVNNVANPQIAGVTIAEDLNDVSTTYVDFKGTFSPTALDASENILCLGGSNSLGWPSAAGNLNGMRAYFEIHSLPAGAPALRHARFIAPGQHVPTAIDDAQGKEGRIEKVIEDGQVIIIRDGKRYNVLGINK